ncbi:MAG: IPTL-CTERM sorting domain-containing protein, partial [Acidobacteriota bacterium]
DSLTISDDLIVLEKEFLDDPVAPGGTVQLEFRLMNTSATDSIVALSFTDDLAAALSGLVAIDTPMMNVCGAGSSITGTSLLTFTAGTLPAGGMCAFTVTLQVPAGADPSTVQPNITSAPTGMSAGLMVEGTPAQDTLMVDRLSFSKSFGGDSAPTGTTTLTFTIQNLSGTIPASQLSFTDDLDAVLSGLVAIDTPMSDVCGTGSQISGTSLLALTGGTLLPGGSCTITVTVQVPAGAAPGTVTNTSSDLFSAGLSAAPAATADLLINPAPTFAKVFTPDAIGVGGISTLTFTIDNTGSTLAATALDFTDSLPAGLEVAATPNASNTCTAGTLTAVAGSGTISYTGGTVAAAAACTLAVDVTPTAAGTLVNTSGALTSSSGSSGTATDTLRADPQPGFAKAFAPNPIAIGTTTTLTFTIDNTGSLNAATSLDFIDALPAGLEVAAMPNASTTCTVGTLTAVAGSGTISYTGGTVAASSSCTVQVDVTGVTPGMLVNTSGALTSSLGSSGTATDTLEVTVAALTFAKAFAPNPIAIGTTTTLTLTIDNPNAADISGLDFSDPLPTGLEVAAAPNASTTCTGGTLTAVAGTTTISYTGGTIPANASCTVSVDILGADSGMFLNTSSQLTSDIGTTPAATDTLEVTVAALTFAKAFAPNPIAIGTTTTLTFTIDNPNAADIGGLDFNDPLPTGLEVAATPNASTTCIGGTLTAVAGTTTISYTGGTIPANASCTVSVDILGADSGMFLNTSSQLTSDAGTAPAATDTLEVTVAALTFAKEFQPDTIDVMDTSTLVFTIDNPNAADIGGLDFNDTLPSGLEVASPANAATTCIGGTLTAVAGSGSITYSGGTVAAGSTCTVSVDVLAPMTGTFDNTSSDLTSDAGTSPPATDTLTVVEMLEFSKSFGAQPVLPGGLVTLTFTIENTSPTSATALAFTDDLDAVIPGLAATDTPVNDVCGAGSTLAGTTTLTLSGGTLISGASCTFDVTLQVPNDAVTGTFTNTTSALSATFGATTTETNAATDDLTTAFLGFEKMFGDAMVFGGQTTTLIFTITNPDPSNAATDLAFTDDLDAALSGLEAIDTPQSDVCGVGSTLTGTSVLTLAGGSLGPGATCTFQVTVMVPEAAPDGTVTNVTSPLSASIGGGTTTGGPADVATATLGIDANAIAIPTLGTWSMALLAGLLAFAATARLRRRVD